MTKHFEIYLLLVFSLICASCNACVERVVLGDERSDVYLPLLEGRRVAIFSNHSGIVGDRAEGLKVPAGRIGDDYTDEMSLVPFGTPADTAVPVKYGPHILDVLLSQDVNVTAIFSPEHGFRGGADPGESVSSSVDEQTGVPILSLYSSGDHMPSAESMDCFDVLVVDIQDVGLRYYTYYITMHHLMEACAKYGKSVVVLDRPNPNGFYVDGPNLDMQFKSGIGWLPIAMVHGMTLGELAQMIVGEGWLENSGLDLHVVPCLNYSHSTKYQLLLPPSPNLKDQKSIYLYASTCFFEGSEVTAGRGTQWPFEIYGHPLMKGSGPATVGDTLTFIPRSIPGAKKPRYMDQECHGVDLRGVPLETIWAEGTTLKYLLDACSRMLWDGSPFQDDPASFFLSRNHFEKQIGQAWAREDILSCVSEGILPAQSESALSSVADALKALWADDVAAFLTLRQPYLLYAE